MRNRIGLRCAIVCLFGVAVHLLGGDWSRFRGPNGSGVAEETGIPIEFGPDKNVVWRTPLPEGNSSPVFARNSIFLTAYEGDSLFTFALDRNSGRIQWRREITRTRRTQLRDPGDPASPSAVTDGENAYVFFPDFGLLSYGPDGNERWRVPLGPFITPVGFGTSPILADGKVIMVCDDEADAFMIAVEKDSGKIAWRNKRPFATRGFATPVLWDPGDGTGLQVITLGSYQLVAYSVATGEKVWWVRGLTWQMKAVPVMDEENIYVQGWSGSADLGQQEEIAPWKEVLQQHDKDRDGRISMEEVPAPYARITRSWDRYDLDRTDYMEERDWTFFRNKRKAVNSIMAIRLGGRGDRTESAIQWRYYKSLPNVSSPLLYDNVLYMVKDGGIVTAFDPQTGEVHKQARLRQAMERYFASPVAADGRIFMVSEGGKVSVIRPGPDWEVIRVNDMGDECYATPTFVDGKIYLRTTAALYCFAKGK